MTVALTQALDFAQEVTELARLLTQLPAHRWSAPTRFKAWSANDIVRHLHFWNEAADWAVHQPQAFEQRKADVLATVALGAGMRPVEARHVPAQGPELLRLWHDLALDMAARWQTLPPSQRVNWVGPTMSVRSCITARQMETWAHGQAVFDAMGQTRHESARLYNLVVLGVNTFGWSHLVRQWPVPEHMPMVQLRGPAGEDWVFGSPNEAGSVCGSALGFCQTVTQTRHVSDTDLVLHGEVATRWMQHAQCFAGPPEQPPAPGTRRMD